MTSIDVFCVFVLCCLGVYVFCFVRMSNRDIRRLKNKGPDNDQA